jgi:hypothetical protein
MARLKIDIKQGESKLLNFTIKSKNTMSTVDVSGAEFTFTIQPNEYEEAILTKSNTDFITTNAINGIVSTTLLAVDTEDLDPGVYTGELKIEFDGGGVSKSVNIEVNISSSLT